MHGAFTEEYSAFWLGARSLDSMADAGILPDFAGIVVSDRYQNYFHPRSKRIAGNQACLSHLLRDYQDCAESYPGAVWPVQAQRTLRGMIHAWHAAREQGLPAIPDDTLKPLAHEFRHAVLAGLASVPRVPGPKNSTKQQPGRELLEFCRDRRDDVLRFTTDTRIWPTNNISERGVRPLKTQQKISGRLTSNDVTQDRLDTRSYIDTARKHGTTPWTSCTTSCPAGPGDLRCRHSPRNPAKPAPPITMREWAECLRVYVSAPPASSVTVTAGQRAQVKVPGKRTREVTLDPGDLRTLRSEDKGQAGACPDGAQAIPCKVRAVAGGRGPIPMIRP